MWTLRNLLVGFTRGARRITHATGAIISDRSSRLDESQAATGHRVPDGELLIQAAQHAIGRLATVPQALAVSTGVEKKGFFAVFGGIEVGPGLRTFGLGAPEALRSKTGWSALAARFFWPTNSPPSREWARIRASAEASPPGL